MDVPENHMLLFLTDFVVHAQDLSVVSWDDADEQEGLRRKTISLESTYARDGANNTPQI